MNKEYRCPNCFKGNIETGKCRMCGFDRQEEKQNPRRLPEMMLLQERYTTGRILGCGGFGITYKSFDILNQCFCAVKEFIPMGIATRMEHETQLHVTSNSNLGDFEHGKKRFMEEAQVLKKLTDVPEVVQILDYFNQNNTTYFVMEYLEGADLRKLMQTFGGRIPVKDTVSLIYRAGMALDQVHKRAGVFHRDISPDNIMVNQDGEVKLIDFGNAKFIMGKRSQTLSVVLKHGYAPPEQYSSSSSQGSYTDVYALAATFYYAVSGIMVPNAPDRFGGETYRPLKEIVPEIGAEISDAVDHALVLNSKERTQSAAEFVSAFYPAKTGTGAKEEPYLKLVGNGREYSWKIPENTMVKIGRSNELADIIPTKDVKISKVHCNLYFDSREKRFYLIDYRSTNGTYIKGSRIERGKTHVLLNGEQFSLGNHICDLEVGWKHE